jgi:hypothetical protein
MIPFPPLASSATFSASIGGLHARHYRNYLGRRGHILTAIVTFMPLQLSSRLMLAGAACAWVGFAGAVASVGALSNPTMVLTIFGTPLTARSAILLGIPVARRAFSAVPLPALIGLNALRMGGILFVLLAFAGRLSGPFSAADAGGPAPGTRRDVVARQAGDETD